MKLIAPIVLIAVLLTTSLSFAEELTPGKLYEGGTSLEVSSYNVAFKTPKGWKGTLPQGSEFFVLQQGNGDDGNIFLWATEASKSEVVAAMNEGIPVAQGISLKPKSKAKVSGDKVTGDFSVVGQAELSATITAKAHKSGTAVAVIAIYKKSSEAKYKKTSKSVFNSLKFQKPKKAAKGTASGPWVDKIRNHRLTRFYSGSGYSEKESYTFCGNGVYYRNFDASSSTQLGTGAAVSKGDGTWSLSGSTITLNSHQGGSSQLTLEARGTKTFINDRRWFREPISCN